MSGLENLKNSSSIVPYRLEQPLSDDDDFSDFPLKGPPLSNVIALTGKELDPGAINKFIAGAAPGKLALRFSVDEAKVVDAFDFMSFATDTYFSIYGPSRGTEQGEYLETITERPSRTEADWRPGKDDRRHWFYHDGREIKETLLIYMIVDGRVIAFRARSSALRPMKDMLNRAGRLSARYPVEVNGKVENQLFHGPLISKWRMSTFEHREAFRYWTPLPTLLGKLGEAGGPSFEEYLFARRARETFRQNGLLLNKSPLIEPPHVPQPPLLSDGKPAFTTGPQAPRRRVRKPPACLSRRLRRFRPGRRYPILTMCSVVGPAARRLRGGSGILPTAKPGMISEKNTRQFSGARYRDRARRQENRRRRLSVPLPLSLAQARRPQPEPERQGRR